MCSVPGGATGKKREIDSEKERKKEREREREREGGRERERKREKRETEGYPRFTLHVLRGDRTLGRSIGG